MAESSGPEVRKIVDGVKSKTPIELTNAEVLELSKEDKKEALIREAKSMSKAEREALASSLWQETHEALFEGTATVSEGSDDHKKLDQLIAEIEAIPDAAATAPALTPAETKIVSDILSEKPGDEKKTREKINEFAENNPIIGTIVKAWIDMQKMFGEFFPPANAAVAAKRIASIDKLYGRFFGAPELRTKINDELLKDTGLQVVRGKADGAAYAKLQEEYTRALTEKKTTADAYPFDIYLDEKVKKALSLADTTDTAYSTTLMGIANAEKPVETPAA